MSNVENICRHDAQVGAKVVHRDLLLMPQGQDEAREKRAALEQIEPVQTKRRYEPDPKKSRYYYCYISEQEQPYYPFPKQFGMPPASYWRLLLDLKRNGAFQLWLNKNHNADKEPIELLLLGSLRALKNAKYQRLEDMSEVDEDKFLDISSLTHIEPDVLNQFFHYLLSEGCSTVYANYIHGSSFVVTAEKLEHLNNLVNAGLFGVYEAKMKKRLREIQKRQA